MCYDSVSLGRYGIGEFSLLGLDPDSFADQDLGK
jgi:hypothetical protein